MGSNKHERVSTSLRKQEQRVVRAAMRSFNIHLKEKGSLAAFLSTSMTPHGRALVRACAALAKMKKERK